MLGLKQEFDQVMVDIAPLKPYWSKLDGMYLFQHPDYPTVIYADTDPEKVIAGYQRAMRAFLKARMTDALSPIAERSTSGRGGLRPGAGRPRNEARSVRISLPEDIGAWLKANPAHLERVRKLMDEAS